MITFARVSLGMCGHDRVQHLFVLLLLGIPVLHLPATACKLANKFPTRQHACFLDMRHCVVTSTRKAASVGFKKHELVWTSDPLATS